MGFPSEKRIGPTGRKGYNSRPDGFGSRIVCIYSCLARIDGRAMPIGSQAMPVGGFRKPDPLNRELLKKIFWD